MNFFIDTSPNFCSTPALELMLKLASPSNKNSAALQRLVNAAPPPIDHVGLLHVARGAAAALECTARLLKLATPEIQEYCDSLKDLYLNCKSVQDELGVTDTFGLDKRRLSGSPAWRLLATVGTDFSVDSGLSAAAGILLLRSLVKQKAMPVALCKAICLEATELQCNANVLLAELMRPNAEIENKTLRRLSSNLCDLLVLVGSGKKEEKNINQVARDTWTARAAFPSVHTRSAILDQRCLSASQIQAFNTSKSCAPFNCLKTKRAAIFFGEFSGLAPSHLAEIPIISSSSQIEELGCNIQLDLEGGFLIKNYGVICEDASSFTTHDTTVQSYLFKQPIPSCVHATLLERFSNSELKQKLGDLFPELKADLSRTLLYPSHDGIQPTWSKLRFSSAPFLRQHGVDALLAASVTADFATTLKSKLYYCRVSSDEILHVCQLAYRLLGFEPANTAVFKPGFGSSATSADSDLRKIDQLFAKRVHDLQPANKAGGQGIASAIAALGWAAAARGTGTGAGVRAANRADGRAAGRAVTFHHIQSNWFSAHRSHLVFGINEPVRFRHI